MALKRNERYPGRFSNPTTAQPQGAFKNRTAPGAQDGSYLEQDWANDWSGFFGRLLTVAGITPNGNVDTALSSQYYDALNTLLLTRQTKYGAPMIGELVEWPRSEMPQEIWPDCGMEFIPYMGQSFDAVKYPLLSQLHPTNILPADMRGQVPRGWDNARGIDTTRVLMSEQGDAIRNITGTLNGRRYGITGASGVFALSDMSLPTTQSVTLGANERADQVTFDASRVVPTAAESRMKNVAWNMIVRAK